jgi:hypothetical protein
MVWGYAGNMEKSYHIPVLQLLYYMSSTKILFDSMDVDELTLQSLENGDMLLTLVCGATMRCFRLHAEDISKEVLDD